MIRRRLPESVRFFMVSDPAVDADSYRAYVDADYDHSLLRFKPGEVPTEFVIAPLTRKQRALVEQAPNEYVRKQWIVLCGLKNLVNYAIVDESGRERLVAPPPEQKDGIPQESWLDQAHFGDEEIIEVSTAIERIGSLRAPLLNASGQAHMPG